MTATKLLLGTFMSVLPIVVGSVAVLLTDDDRRAANLVGSSDALNED
ncbi:MAG: hypothetical protein JWP16_598 [Alphaproteobacteria bacterium]|nr:hypothetical protein [Alphaproteobacteria bacterium]